MREKCPYSELLWSVFSRIQTKYGEIRSICPYSVRMRENTDQNNSEYGQFSRSVPYPAQRRIQSPVKYLKWSFCEIVSEMKIVKGFQIFVKIYLRCSIGFWVHLCLWKSFIKVLLYTSVLLKPWNLVLQ